MDELHCREVVEALTDYLERALGPAARDRLQAHLAECRGCADYLEQLRTTIRLVGGLSGARGSSPGRR